MMVLWVDDNPNESKKIWDELEVTHNSGVMIPFVSTKELEQWLKTKKAVLDDPTAQVMLITNMTRYDEEEDEKDEYAGVKAIQAFHKYKADGPVFVYNWWIEGTLKKLSKHDLNPSRRLRVSDKPKEVKEFMRKFGFDA